MAPISLTKFQNIAYQCIHEESSKRPTAYALLIQLKKALENQEKWEDLNTSLDEIMLATQDFCHDNLIGKSDFWSVYKGQVTCADGCEIIAAKRLDRRSCQRETERMAELEILLEYTHENIISLVGYCNEKGEKILVYDYASISKGSLDRWLKYDGLTWRKRLEICIDIARGLVFLHGTSDIKQEVVIHGDIKSSNILLDDDWKAKITDFGQSLVRPIHQEIKHVVNNAKGTPGYCDPQNITTGFLTKESDIYSFGVLLFEMLCGRSVMEDKNSIADQKLVHLVRQLVMKDKNSKAQNLVHLVRQHYDEGKLYDMVFEATKTQMAPKSFTTFQKIAYRCIHEDRTSRPIANDVLIQLQLALKDQLDFEVWEPQLPRDYKKIIQTADSRDMSYEDIYTSLHQGILLQNKKVWFSVGANGERVERRSAAELHFYSPSGRLYWISESQDRESSNECMELTYKIGNKYFHSHYTEDTADGWSMIPLYQFPNPKDGVDIDIIVEGFLGSHFKKQAIYLEGVEFRAISNMTQEEIEELEKVNMAEAQQSPTDMARRRYHEKEKKPSIVFRLQSIKLKLMLLSSSRAIEDLAIANFLFLLMEIVDKVEVLAKEVEVLGSVACFQSQEMVKDMDINFDMTVRHKAIFECLGAPHAQDFLLAIPIGGLVCRKACLDSFGEHAVHCKELSGFKYRHDMVRDVLFDVCRLAGISAKKEAPVNFLTDALDGRSTLRPADVLIF
ncbi:kinase-like domain, phloem protein 2-like protein [Tanacetum coccineum]